MTGRPRRLCAALAALLLLGGCALWTPGPPHPDSEDSRWCALARVKPWERDLFARTEMAWQPNPHEAARRQHIYFSKEGSLAGGSAGGGGCGCN